MANRFLSSQPSVCLVCASYGICLLSLSADFSAVRLGFVVRAGGGWCACIRLFSPLTRLFVRLCCVFLQSFALHSSSAVHFFASHSMIVVWAGIICSLKFKNVLKASTKLIYFVEYRRTKPTPIKAFHSLCKRAIHCAMVYIKQGFLITTKVLFCFIRVLQYKISFLKVVSLHSVYFIESKYIRFFGTKELRLYSGFKKTFHRADDFCSFIPSRLCSGLCLLWVSVHFPAVHSTVLLVG